MLEPPRRANGLSVAALSAGAGGAADGAGANAADLQQAHHWLMLLLQESRLQQRWTDGAGAGLFGAAAAAAGGATLLAVREALGVAFVCICSTESVFAALPLMVQSLTFIMCCHSTLLLSFLFLPVRPPRLGPRCDTNPPAGHATRAPAGG